MTSSLQIFGSTFLYPKLNILQIDPQGKRKFYNLDFMKYYFLSSLVFGLFFSRKIFRKLKTYMQVIYYKYLSNILKFKSALNKRKIAIIFGFGDSSACINFTKYLINSGFYLILLNTEKNLEFRKKYNLNKFEDLENLDSLNFLLSYEELVKNPKILKDKIGNDGINQIFDFTSFRVNIKETEEENDTLNNNEIQKQTEINNKHFNMEGLYYNSEINLYMKNYMDAFDELYTYFKNTKILIFDYRDKRSDLNHKLLYDLKISFLENLKNINVKKSDFIHYVKSVSGIINYKYQQFTENHAKRIMNYIDIVDYEYVF